MLRTVAVSTILAAAAVACGDTGSQPDAGDDTGGDAGGCGAEAEGQPGVAVTTSGAFRGVAAEAGGLAYLGVPYAAPPTGERRFQPPAPAACAAGITDADALGARCPQLDPDTGAYLGDEDCLTLNVWVPDTATADRPVMVWIHGGGNAIGGSAEPYYRGDRLAAAGDVVVVTINYRLGQLGYLAHPAIGAGNAGLLDQVAALAWVRDNAAAFGGDPGNVTIFGESAGGRNVCTLLATPAAADLFHRAIIQSGACKFLDTLAQAEDQGAAVIAALGCDGDADVAACARAASAEAVTRAAAAPVGALLAATYGPNVDGDVLPEQAEDAIRAGRHHAVPLIVGANADETSGVAPLTMTQQAYEAAIRATYGATLGDAVLAEYAAISPPRAAYVKVTTDARFLCPSREITRSGALGQDEPVRRYLFSYDASPLGAVHGLDVPYVFGTFDAVETAGGAPYEPTATDLALSAQVQRYWTQFARTGDPASGGDPAWPAWPASGDGDPAMDLSAAPGVVEGAGAEHCDFWRPIYEAL